MPIQRMFQYAGLARQTAKGSAAASPTFGLPTRGGGLLVVEVEQDPDPLTWRDTYRTPYEADRKAVRPGMSLATRAYLRALGLLLYGALGQISSSGTTDYTHTITQASSLPYLTAWTLLGTERAKVVDCKVDELAISWDGRGLLDVDVTLLGLTSSFGESAFTAATDESTGERLSPVGSTLKVDVGSATPVVAPVRAGEFRIRNNLTRLELASSVLPADVVEGASEVTCNLTLVPDDLGDWREFLTGTASGTSATAAPIYGSVDLLFQIAANKSLQIVIPRCAFTVSFPEGDTGGGPVELSLEGTALRQASAGAVTATLKNQVASY
jgi:hypothetical protein